MDFIQRSIEKSLEKTEEESLEDLLEKVSERGIFVCEKDFLTFLTGDELIARKTNNVLEVKKAEDGKAKKGERWNIISKENINKFLECFDLKDNKENLGPVLDKEKEEEPTSEIEVPELVKKAIAVAEKRQDKLENDMYNKLHKKLEKEYDEADNQDLYAKKLKEDLEKFEIGKIDTEDEEFIESFGLDKEDKKSKRLYKKVLSKILSELENAEETDDTDDKEKKYTADDFTKAQREAEAVKSEVEKVERRWNNLEDFLKRDVESLKKYYNKSPIKELAITSIKDNMESYTVNEEYMKSFLEMTKIEFTEENKERLSVLASKLYGDLLKELEKEPETESGTPENVETPEIEDQEEIEKMSIERLNEEAMKINKYLKKIKKENETGYFRDAEFLNYAGYLAQLESAKKKLENPEITPEIREGVPKNMREIIEKMRNYEWSLQKKIAEISEENKEKLEDYNMGEDQSEEDRRAAKEVIKLKNMSKMAALDEFGAEIAASSFEENPRKRRKAAEAVSEDLGNLLKTLQAEILIQQKESNRRELGGEKDKLLRNFVNVSKDRIREAISKEDNQQIGEQEEKSKFELGWLKLKEKLRIGGENIEEMKEKISEATKLEDLAEVADLINGTYNNLFTANFKESLRKEDQEALRKDYSRDMERIKKVKLKKRKEVLVEFYEKLDELLKKKEEGNDEEKTEKNKGVEEGDKAQDMDVLENKIKELKGTREGVILTALSVLDNSTLKKVKSKIGKGGFLTNGIKISSLKEKDPQIYEEYIEKMKKNLSAEEIKILEDAKISDIKKGIKLLDEIVIEISEKALKK